MESLLTLYIQQVRNKYITKNKIKKKKTKSKSKKKNSNKILTGLQMKNISENILTIFLAITIGILSVMSNRCVAPHDYTLHGSESTNHGTTQV